MSQFNGTPRADRLTGTELGDRLIGLAGNDTLTALGGDDTLDGGADADRLTGGRGNDIYILDHIGDRVIERAGEGTDTVHAGNSYPLAANVENLLLAGAGAINGTGNALDNTIIGNGAANTLSGLYGNDVLEGGAGNDVLVGGRGRDTLTGGAGADTFRFLNGDLASRSLANADTIVDFKPGDHIDLSQVDALVAASEYIADGKQDFHFIGTNRFHIHSGKEIRYEITGNDTLVYGSTNGDAIADFVIRLEGVHKLVSGDFLF